MNYVIILYIVFYNWIENKTWRFGLYILFSLQQVNFYIGIYYSNMCQYNIIRKQTNDFCQFFYFIRNLN